MKIAEVVSQRSSCNKRQVGCIIVKDNQIVSEGYNGTPPKWHTNDCEDKEGNTKDCVSHAESNAISKAASSPVSVKNGIMYCTLSPCFQCSKQIAQCGIDKVYYRTEYKNTKSLEYLRECGIKVNRLNG